MSLRVRSLVFPALVATLTLAAAPGFAAGSDSGSSESAATRASYADGKAAVEAGQYRKGIKILTAVVKAEPANADALNLLGFANRKIGQTKDAQRYYLAALRSDPKHLGALEYQGELYIQLGEIAKARANLDRLQGLCGNCEEFQDLQSALAAAG